MFRNVPKGSAAKREAGEIPARTRRCKRVVLFTGQKPATGDYPLGKENKMSMRKPEDLHVSKDRFNGHLRCGRKILKTGNTYCGFAAVFLFSVRKMPPYTSGNTCAGEEKMKRKSKRKKQIYSRILPLLLVFIMAIGLFPAAPAYAAGSITVYVTTSYEGAALTATAAGSAGPSAAGEKNDL